MKLLNTHFAFLWTKKLFIVFHLIFLLIGILLLGLSNLIASSVSQSFNARTFLTSYYYSGIFYIKLIIIIVIMLFVIYAFFMNDYDLYLVTDKNKVYVLLSKLITLYLLVLYLLTISYLFFIGLKSLMPYASFSGYDIKVYSYLCIFSGYYLIIFVLSVYLYKHIFVIVVPITGYLLSMVTIDFGTSASDLSGLSRFIQLWFVDVVYIDELYTLLYGPMFVLSFLLFLLVSLIRIYYKKDII